ncbi:uncharacterized protein LOC119719083 [Patiria miniata]|uniref:Uncharacterized protein n=1 Tax=Patiria miniata TaxID=46514 RepID=A0A913Z0X6_PATMI|nr:uncharacterized protein LOC119719083 [Patiria miniata]
MDDFLRRLTRVHRRDLPVEPAEPATARSPSSPSRLLDYLISSTTTTTTSPDYLGNFTLPNDTTTGFPESTLEQDGHVRSNEAFPLSSFAVIKAVVLAIVLGILLLTSCRVVGKIVCKNSSKDQAEQ